MVWTSGSLHAKGYLEQFEGEANSWRFLRGSSQARILHHVRTKEAPHTGQRCEQLTVSIRPNDGRVSLVHKLPLAVRFDELKAAVWVWSNHPGVQVSVQVKLPGQLDQRTGNALSLAVYGDIHSGGGQWQRLSIDLSDRGFEETLRRVRSDLARRTGIGSINVQGAYIDQMALQIDPNEVVDWDVKIDDLEVQPVIAPQINPQEPDATSESTGPRIRIGDDRILLDGAPFFPLMIPYHGESAESLARTNCNLVWIPDYQDSSLTQALAAQGLGVVATPPQPDLETEVPEELGLLPFTATTDPVLFWMLDVQVPVTQLKQAAAWAEMVRVADRSRSRPIMADVMGKEREFHRQIPFVGASRSIIHTSKSPRTYAETLELRRRIGLPVKPMFTFIQTEPSREILSVRPPTARPPVVEPEQIWMQTDIALAAGYKAIGYLSYESLEGQATAAEERRRMLEILGFRMRSLEPWLATSKVLNNARVQVGNTSPHPQSPLLSRWDVFPGQRDTSPLGIAASQIQATILECDHGLVILVYWLEEDAQYQPGRMVTRDVRILVNRDIVQACEMTTTNLLEHTLDLTPVAGGTELRLVDFDQSAIILVPNDRASKDTLNAQIARIRPLAAESWVKLARAKLTRVREVSHELLKSAPRQPNNADAVLRTASRYVDQAEKSLAAGKYSEVEELARIAMSYMRDLQKAHWQIAVSMEKSPASSPYTNCFQTLPEHWSFKSRLQVEVSPDNNLLPSGSFDQPDDVATGWTRTSSLPAGSAIVTTAAIVGPTGNSHLHLGATADKKKPAPIYLDQIPLTLASPPIPVTEGQLVRIQGKLLIPQSLTSSPDGLMLYDSTMGTAGALRFSESTKGEWSEFEFYREIVKTGDLRLLMELRGLGQVMIDDLSVVAIEPSRSVSPAPVPQVESR